MAVYPEDKNTLRSFGLLMGGLLSVIATVLFYKEKMTAFAVFGGIAGIFLFSALVRPKILAGVYSRWTKFADIIGRFNAKVILSLIYGIVFTLMRALLFVLRKDPLQRKFDSSLDSYWCDHEPLADDPKRYEKQF